MENKTRKNKLGNPLTVAMLVSLVAFAQPAAFAATSFSSTATFVVVNSFADADDDGLLDDAEHALNTNPTTADSDGDGLDDAYEVWHGLNPSKASDATEDPDGDSLINLDEYELGSHPFDVDTDGDGFWDHIEFERGTDPAAAHSRPVRSAAADVDANGRVDAVDVQLVVNGALGMSAPVPVNVDNAGGVNALDVQQVINAAVR